MLLHNALNWQKAVYLISQKKKIEKNRKNRKKMLTLGKKNRRMPLVEINQGKPNWWKSRSNRKISTEAKCTTQHATTRAYSPRLPEPKRWHLTLYVKSKSWDTKLNSNKPAWSITPDRTESFKPLTIAAGWRAFLEGAATVAQWTIQTMPRWGAVWLSGSTTGARKNENHNHAVWMRVTSCEYRTNKLIDSGSA